MEGGMKKVHWTVFDNFKKLRFFTEFQTSLAALFDSP
jgi:hypothetical protein